MANKRFSDEVKETIVRLYNNGNGREIKDLAIEYGVPQSTVRYWVIGQKKRAEKSKLKSESHSELEQIKKEMKKLKEENDILKKAIIIFAKKLSNEQSQSMITELSRVHPISKLTKVLEVPKSTYYYRKLNKLTVNKTQREKLSKLIYEIWLRSHKRYGAPKIHQELIKVEELHSLKHIQNLMREKDIRSITVKKFKPQGGNKYIEENKVPNILEQNFSSEKAYEKIVGDITYIYTKRNGWCYLSSYMDLYNNEILGWSFSKEMTTKTVIESLEMACLKIKNTSSVIVHTDRGSQYTSNIYKEIIEKKEMKGSYSRKGNPYDNACIESFHSVLKKELIHQQEYTSYEEANKEIIEYIEGWYNKRRIQKKLNWQSPLDYKKCS